MINHPSIRIVTTEREYLPLLLLPPKDAYLIFKDQFSREWKLIPVENEAIKFPFVVVPIGESK